MALSKSALYYRNNPEAREKKNEYNKIHQKRTAQRLKRQECNKFNRDNGTYGNGDKIDCSHKNGRLTKENQSTNRARGGAERK